MVLVQFELIYSLSASGLDFESVYLNAIETSIDAIPVRVIALDDLITNKRASGRPHDLADVELLERIRNK